MIKIPITPIGKPRMVKSDSWKKRPAVQRYWAFKDELVYLCREAGYKQGIELYATFCFPMPKSWSKTVRTLKNGMPHDQRADVDNILKGCLDSLLPEGDEKVHIVCVNKVWSEHPAIIFYDSVEEWMAATE